MASTSAKFHLVVSGNSSVINPLMMITQQFDLGDALTKPENPQARQQAVIRLVSDMPAVHHTTGCCSVCMENFWQSQEAARQVSCGHVYHHSCITDWLLNGNNNSCPLCRREISG
ncbi:hypothetical protein PTKIN_Ptkin19aG0065800 [Pterospermum kingtungense]